MCVLTSVIENVFRFIYASLNHDHGKVFRIHLTRFGMGKRKTLTMTDVVDDAAATAATAADQVKRQRRRQN